MSSAPWFKFYPGDYLADTQRLTQTQHGAYMLLMLDYYSRGEPPPDDDVVLARITLSDTVTDWLAIRSPIRRFFDIRDGLWFHNRIEQELKQRQNERKARQDAAFKTNLKLGRNTVTDTVTDTVTGTHSRYQIPDTRVPESRNQKPEPEPENQNQARSKTTPRKNGATLPGWIPREAWQGFIEMRKKIRAPLTDRAEQLVLMTLEKLRGKGQDPGAVLNQSVEHSWRGVFPMRTGKETTSGANRRAIDEWLAREEKVIQGERIER